MAKADLIADAEKRGLTLTGKETVAELEALLESNGESAAEVEEEAAVVELDPTKHVLIEGSDSPVEFPAGSTLVDGKCCERVLSLGGRNYEHVSDHSSGVWVYRRM